MQEKKELVSLQKELVRNQIKESQLHQEFLVKQINNYDDEHDLIKRSMMISLQQKKNEVEG
jgi:hypothetical protein